MLEYFKSLKPLKSSLKSLKSLKADPKFLKSGVLSPKTVISPSPTTLRWTNTTVGFYPANPGPYAQWCNFRDCDWHIHRGKSSSKTNQNNNFHYGAISPYKTFHLLVRFYVPRYARWTKNKAIETRKYAWFSINFNVQLTQRRHICKARAKKKEKEIFQRNSITCLINL